MKSKAILILALLLIPAIFALPDHAAGVTRKHGKHHHHRREHPRSGKTEEKDSGRGSGHQRSGKTEEKGSGGGSGGGGGFAGGFFGPGNDFGMPDFGSGYGAGFGDPNGGGYAKGGAVRPTVVCKEKGPCYGKTLRCPEKCFKAYSRAGKGYGYGGGGGGCTMDCTKKCLAYC